MIDSVTIFSKTGIILYHYTITTKSNHIDNDHINNMNQIISLHLKFPTEKIIELNSTSPPLLAECSSSSSTGDEMVMVTYPKVIANHADTSWLEYYMRELLQEFKLFQSKTKEHNSTLFNPVQEAILEKSQILGKQQKKNASVLQKEHIKTNKKGKVNTVWHDREQKVTSKTMASLDYSKETHHKDGVVDLTNALMEARAAYLPDDDEMPDWEEEEKMKLCDDDNETSGWGSSLKGMLGQVSGKVLTDADLERPLKDMENILTSKNVATEIAEEICNRVRVKLVGKKMASFTRVKTAVRQALEDAIEKILKPGRGRGGIDDVDVLRDVISKREKGNGFLRGRIEKPKPYVIVMVGINGVGKSTSLAKIAYYLKSQGCNPLLAACDTFRSGAVEQLNVHAKCLNVPLYHKGYAKDPSAVARAAINQATENGHDVVLVDTAGRMQNNLPLMKALSSLVVQNNPDLVLFVCEALVGNDGIDQLEMFNKALRSGGHSRKIDGIVLTKFDTISDKVGAALTMTQVTGSPVVFVGTGQKYNHLKKLSVQSVIKSMFS